MMNSVQKTKYQGERRVLGHFKCDICRRYWESANSWANKGQQCKKCNVMIYPYDQEPLLKSDNKIDPNKPHDQAKCEKCQELGSICFQRHDLTIEDQLEYEYGLSRSRKTAKSKLHREFASCLRFY